MRASLVGRATGHTTRDSAHLPVREGYERRHLAVSGDEDVEGQDRILEKGAKTRSHTLPLL